MKIPHSMIRTKIFSSKYLCEFLLAINIFYTIHISYSRVHITKSTLEYLGDKFEVEPGGGASREAYLADHKVESYLIIPPKVSFSYF